MTERRCPFQGCGVDIPATKFACNRHWFKLTPRQRSIIWAAYRDWQAARIDGDGLKRIQEDILKEAETGAPITTDTQPCTGCGAPILWLRTAATGRRCPIDPAPVPDGNIVIRGDTAVYLALSLYETDGQPQEGELRYKSHFATCPNAAAFRVKKRKPK